MFEPQPHPRVFALAPGADFSGALAAGLLARFAGMDPFAVARTTVLVNTNRAARRLTGLLAATGARLLPRIRPIPSLALAPDSGLPLPISALGRRLELAQLVLGLLDRAPELAPRAAAFDLAERLAALIDEMHEEQVPLEALRKLDFGALSAHWEQSARVLALIAPWFDAKAAPSAAMVLQARVAQLIRQWQTTPPTDPLIIAGSTGSRGTTFRLMQAVARLPQGALVLPGFDFSQPQEIWRLIIAERVEDHPQFRLARLLHALHLEPSAVVPWDGTANATPRERLISLALRPAPVSDQWIIEGPQLGDLVAATAGLSLIEAPSPRAEAAAVATVLREAVHRGKLAAVVTPDRELTRQIAAELSRWGIVPDDSAGEPLALTAQGRLLRQSAALLVEPARLEAILALLKHPLVAAGPGRGRHLDFTRRLELRLRRAGHPWPGATELTRLAGPDAEDWSRWVACCVADQIVPGRLPLTDLVERHLALAERLSEGPAEWARPAPLVASAGSAATDSPAPPPLWRGNAGEEARRVMQTLARESAGGGALDAREYLDLLGDLLSRAEVRPEAEAHTGVRIWGTIEARIQGADLMVLAGLNEGRWPAHPAPDPWLNRQMRRTLGLTLPERRIGLAAHDFQQAANAPEVVLSRALRDESAETVPSRWLNRLTNLLAGLSATGTDALAAMRARGQHWLRLAAALDRPGERIPPASRPAPAPPAAVRPRRLSVTEVRTLIRDPYAIYARHILRLAPLDPLRPAPDAAARGTLIHAAIARFLRDTRESAATVTLDAFMQAVDAALAAGAPWPGVRELWRGRLQAIGPWLVAREAERRAVGTPLVIEEQREWAVPGLDFTLRGKPDRIDLLADGSAEIVDYKTGSVPKAADVRHYDRQLLLLALMAEAGAFGSPLNVSKLTYGVLGATPKETAVKLAEFPLIEVEREFAALIRAFADPDTGYLARRAAEGVRWAGDYDHLARFGEWSAADPARPEPLP